MSTCEKLEKCLFFNDNMVEMPAMAKMMKERFCLGDKTTCARYMVASVGKPVPATLYPNNLAEAKNILDLSTD